MRFGREAVFNDNVFTQDFFTENATHKQNCTSFNPSRVITYNVKYGKPFLNVSRSVAQIPKVGKVQLHSYALNPLKIYFRRSASRLTNCAQDRRFSTIAQ
ncbi:hypothetical protein CJP72_04795 [Citrobacter sp. NCU1]|nr:hypothetical protein [Citrobacter sp. NCU1]